MTSFYMPTNQLIATKKGLTQTSSLTTYINPFSTNVLLLYLLKTSENLRFFMFQGVYNETLVENGLTRTIETPISHTPLLKLGYPI